jgi:histidine triad (HIT) family protein
MILASCVFCKIVAGEAPAHMVASTPEAIAFHPLHPVTPGHTLVVPTVHVRDAAEDPRVTAATMREAAILAPLITRGQFNLITSAGALATQTVFHLHIHIVPRAAGDGLALPWAPRGQG